MAPQISSLSRSPHFSFEGNDCLYRSFNGQRVVVDAEGEGQLFIRSCDSPLTVVRGDEVVKEFPLLFRDTVTVTAEQDGYFSADVQTELPEGLQSAESTIFKDRFDGTGWLIGGSGRCQIDGNYEWIELSERCFPIPVFNKLEGEGEFRVVLDRSTRCLLADAWDIVDAEALVERAWKVQNMSRLRSLDSFFLDGSPYEAQIASHLNVGEWTSQIPENNRGLILRKWYDRFHGRQRARVHVDGEVVGVWYEPREDRNRRWAVSSFGIPAEATSGKSSVRISIDPPSGVSLWTVSRMEIWALTPA